MNDETTTTALDTTPIDDAELRHMHEEIVSLFSGVFAVTARALDQVAEMDARGAWAAMMYNSMSHYLNFAVGLSLGAAREHVRVAKALRGLPLLHAAFAKGSISFSKLRALTRLATADNEATLLTVANESTAAQLEKIVRGCSKVTRDQAKRQAESRKCTYGIDDDGMFYMRVKLLPDEGAKWAAAMEKAMTPAKDVPAEILRADAFMSLLTAEAATEIVVHVQAGEVPTVDMPLQGPVAIAEATAQRAACDSSVVTMLHDKEGHVLDVGRRSRKIPAAIRRALQARDKGCRYPGCAHTKADAHHIVSWLEGGATKLENLLTLCKPHHTLLHEGGYHIDTGTDGTLSFVSATGLRTMAAQALPETTQVPQVPTEPWGGTGWWSREIDYSYAVAQLVPALGLQTTR